jgi:hypothetical protein
MENRPIHSQTSNTKDLANGIDTQAPLLGVYIFGNFRLDWQVPPFTTERFGKASRGTWSGCAKKDDASTHPGTGFAPS